MHVIFMNHIIYISTVVSKRPKQKYKMYWYVEFVQSITHNGAKYNRPSATN